MPHSSCAPPSLLKLYGVFTNMTGNGPCSSFGRYTSVARPTPSRIGTMIMVSASAIALNFVFCSSFSCENTVCVTHRQSAIIVLIAAEKGARRIRFDRPVDWGISFSGDLQVLVWRQDMPAPPEGQSLSSCDRVLDSTTTPAGFHQFSSSKR